MSEEKRILSGEEILNTLDKEHVDVDVSEHFGPGAHIRIRPLSAKETFEFIANSKDEEKRNQLMIWLLLKCCVDENGVNQFEESQVENLKSKAFKVFKKVQDAAMKLNGFEEFYEKAKEEAGEGAEAELKEALKNG